MFPQDNKGCDPNIQGDFGKKLIQRITIIGKGKINSPKKIGIMEYRSCEGMSLRLKFTGDENITKARKYTHLHYLNLISTINMTNHMKTKVISYITIKFSVWILMIR